MTGRFEWLAGAALVFALGTGAAMAGPCTGQIAQLEQELGAKGMTTTSSPSSTGSTQGTTGGNATAPGISAAKGIMPAPGSTLQAEQNRQGQASNAASGSAPNPTAMAGGQGPAAGGAPGISATKGMQAAPSNAPGGNQPAGTVTQNRATSAQDVRAQQQGLPTAAEAGGQMAQGTTNTNPQLLVALNNARQADLQGNEQACTKALEEARGYIK